MTDLLPLPEPDCGTIRVGRADIPLNHSDEAMQAYARACVEHALAGRGDGLEPLRKLLQEHLDALTAAQPAGVSEVEVMAACLAYDEAAEYWTGPIDYPAMHAAILAARAAVKP